MNYRPLKSHDFAMSLTVPWTISRPYSQLRKSHGERIRKLIHELFRNYLIFEIQQPSPLFFEGLDTTIHIAGLQVTKNKSISLRWEMNSILMQI